MIISSLNIKGSESRYLLNNPIFVADVKDTGDVYNAGAMVVSDQIWPEAYDDEVKVMRKCLSARGDDTPALVKRLGTSEIRSVESPGTKSLRSRSCNQVVELRVSIHCKGCEGKVRKHLSRMEGVKSFQIDLESKKVTVVGDVTPLSVLSSISKVKNAQLWPSSSSSSSSSSSPVITIGY
ncbi:hypothetical protein QVD17_17600 [Tagetes erecta]|uniref:HMA domain-containing protein n=1 Tax=Tagetes erecta TaxID=13708 RepID=A0AAD8NUH7_TARER|nr:hypothetical protein QVD17_17600 [Tagetes erecta]